MEKKPKWWLAALPLLIFLALAAVFYKQLVSGGGTSDIPSALIGQKAPETELVALDGLMRDGNAVPNFTPDILENKYSLVNIWASWCAPCRQEHPLLMELANNSRFQIVGLNYKDKTGNALRFLGQLGNPYDAVGADQGGRAAIEWGVYGVPETFVVGPDRTILYKHIGPLTPKAIEEKILPLIPAAKGS